MRHRSHHDYGQSRRIYRANCSVCCQDKIIKPTGLMDTHTGPNGATKCPGSGRPPRRRLTEAEHDRAWHTIDGLDWEAHPDPGTVLNAVLAALGIDPPNGEQPQAQQPDADALCGLCGVPQGSHHHPWTSTADAIAQLPWNAA